MKFIVVHPLPKGISREQLETLREKTQQDPEIRGYRSFLNLSEGKGVCVFEAPDKTRLEKWLKANELRYDSIIEVELESYRGEWVGVEKLAHLEI